MTRKHFERIAAALASVRPSFSTDPTASLSQWVDTVQAICDMLARENPRFDRARFVDACYKVQ